ncbi:hypothetical protein MTR67_002950 [Solanum verrucosum]|uniref:Uncharacterized protein n=1 Tax=Solanum verrucosum TaxID=315347 RepID=A0AAF0TDR9_SOLVR|nr:hypothetical protein MTR67_002950 [Solanum verrucosum]
MMAIATREANASVNPNLGEVVVIIRYFTQMNPLKFHGSNVDEDPQEFIDEANVVAEDLSWLSMGNVAKGGIVVNNGLESSFESDVKDKQDLDSVFVDLKKPVSE